MFGNKKLDRAIDSLKYPEQQYKDSKEYLDRQQKIDLLLTLAKILEPGSSVSTANIDTANKKMRTTLEEL